MKKLKKLTILLSSLALAFSLLGFASCKEDTPPTPPAGDGDDTAEFIFPDDDATIVWKNTRYGDGTPDNRFDANEGYYKITLEPNKELFYEFSVSETGLYALYTMSAVNGVTITQYDASTAYIPTDDDGNYIGNEAVVVPEEYGEKAGVLYSKINCSAKYYSEYWRATYGFESTTAQTVEIRFVRIGDPLREPENITTAVAPKELKGKFLNNPNEDSTGKDVATVPFNSKFFYDENYEIQVTPFAGGAPVTVKGFYRMGTKEEPKELIYAMLTEPPTRMFDTTFVDLISNGASLRLYTATAENGDILYNDYENFIMKGTGDASKVCYENAVNEDGLYPVNQELYEFLNYYIDARGFKDMSDDIKALYPDALWLAPCYYYGNVSNGTQAYPYKLSLGNNSISLQKENYVFYNVKWERELNANTNTYINEGYYKLICTSSDVTVKFTHDTTHKNYMTSTGLGSGIQFATDAFEGVTIMVLYTGSLDETTVDIRLEKVEVGYAEKPENIPSAGSHSLSTSAWLSLDGEIVYFYVYQYTATANGTLIFETFDDYDEDKISATVNDTPLEKGEQLEITVEENDVVLITITATESGLIFPIQFALYN